MISEQLNSESKEIVIMPEQTLLKHVEEILESKLEQDEFRQTQTTTTSSSYRGSAFGGSSAASMSMMMGNPQQQQVDIITFAYYHFLSSFGLKSLSIRYLNSLYSGLKKIYYRNQKDNQYAQFLLQIFGFSPEEFPVLRPDQTTIALKTRYLFHLVQRKDCHPKGKSKGLFGLS